MKVPTRCPNPDTLAFLAVLATVLTVIAALVILLGGPFPAVLQVVIAGFVFAAWREVWVFDRYMRCAEAPKLEEITHP